MRLQKIRNSGENTMISYLIKMKNIYFQRDFSENTEERIFSFFNFSAGENLLCAVWTNAFSRYGFVITNKSLYWHLKTNDGIKSGGIIKNQNAEFQISPHISSDNPMAGLANSVAEECSKLEIRISGRTEEFYITALNEEKGKTLCDILKFAFNQGELPQIDLGELVKTPSFLPLRSFCDEVLNITDETIQKINDFKDSTAKAFHKLTHIKFKIKRTCKPENERETYNEEEKSQKESEHGYNSEFEENTDKRENCSKKTDEDRSIKKQTPSEQHNYALAFLLNFLDVCASLFFLSSVIVLLKPELIGKLNLPPEELSKIALAVFTLLKCIVAFHSKNTTRKIIAILLVVISILSNLLLSYSFIMKHEGAEFFIIVSIILCLLSYFAFEFACGFKTETILQKITAIVIFGFALYVIAHYAIYEKKQQLLNSAKYFWLQLSTFCKTL